MKRVFLITLAAICLVCTAAANTPKTGRNKVKITRFDFFIENIDPSFFDDFDEATLFYNFFAYYDDSTYPIRKVKSFKVEAQTSIAWEIDLSMYLEQEQKYIGGYGRWYDTTLSKNGSLLSAGKMVCLFNYKNKKTSKEEVIIPLPGSKEGRENTFVYSEDYNGVKHDNYVMCLKRARIKDAVFTGEKFIIDFAIDDEKAFNGRVWFFDENRDYLGKSDDFIHPFSLETADFLNEGEEFYRDNRKNRLELTADEISLKRKFSFDDVYYIHVVIEDGFQFQDDAKKDNFHYRSVSKYYLVEYVVPSST